MTSKGPDSQVDLNIEAAHNFLTLEVSWLQRSETWVQAHKLKP